MERGIYEHIINQLFEVKLEQMDDKKYYIGKKPMDASNVAKYLSRYLYGLFEQVFDYLHRLSWRRFLIVVECLSSLLKEEGNLYR